MSDIFTHGQMIECPTCPGVGRMKRKPTLRIQSRNYSGCSVDYGVCPECGKSWCISYTIDKMDRAKEWDEPSRKQVEEVEEAADKKQLEETEVNDRIEYKRLQKKFGVDS